MTALTIQDVSRRSGLSEPTLRYYEQVGLISPVGRDPGSGHLFAFNQLAGAQTWRAGLLAQRPEPAPR
jgi:DNA-binding transcriptional MerR regulator